MKAGKLLALFFMFTASLSFAEKEAPSKEKSLVDLATQRRQRPESQLNAEEKQLMDLERRILKLFMSGQLDEGMKYLADNAMVLPPGFETVVGRDNQKVLFQELLKTEGFVMDWEPVDVFVGPSNDMAYVHGVVRWKMPNEPSRFGKYISVWVKQDGKWLNHVEIRNTTYIEGP